MTPTRDVRPYADAGLIAYTKTTHEAHSLGSLARAASWDGVEDVVVGHETVTVVLDPSRADTDEVRAQLEVFEAPSAVTADRRRFDIGVAFDGPDLVEVARAAGRSPTEVKEALVGCELEVLFMGFSPGFAYMGGLPDFLGRIPRRSSPRTTVPAGSVALGGGYLAIYPRSSPGGWHVVGRTDVQLFDPDRPPFSLLGPRDVIRLVERDVGEPPRAQRPRLACAGDRLIEVERPGMLSLIEDLGRIGMASIGVPRSGAADNSGLRLANRLVGNEQSSAAIEITGSGPEIRFCVAAHVAVVGETVLTVDGRVAPIDAVVPVGAGQSLSVGNVTNGLRCYMAVDGGLQTPVVLGSRSCDTLCELGPGPLRSGDLLGLGTPTRPRGHMIRPLQSLERTTLRAVAGPEVFESDQLDLLERQTWQVTAESDRVGVRFVGSRLATAVDGIPSRATVRGALQIPPDGRPIALLADHATVGGYPVVATVIRADLGRLGQLRPGDRVRFQLVDIPTALEALSALERELEGQVAGWFPVRTD